MEGVTIMYCQNCGSKLPGESNFCPSCGTKVKLQVIDAAEQAVASPPPTLPQSQAENDAAMEKLRGKISWQISVPIFRDPIILKQLGLAIGIPFGLLVIILTLISGKSVYTLYALGLIGALFFFTWFFIKLVYKGKYAAEFILDDKGALCRTQAKQAKTNRIVNTLTVLLGLFSGKPAVAGAGMLAESKQQVFIHWKQLTKVKYDPQKYTILLRGGLTENIALFCTREDYPMIEQYVAVKTKHLKGN